MGRHSAKVWPRTVSQELHDAWKKLKRKGDPEVMAAELGYSRPVIDRALLYGYISMPELPDAINKFFKARLEGERQTAQELNTLADQAG